MHRRCVSPHDTMSCPGTRLRRQTDYDARVARKATDLFLELTPERVLDAVERAGLAVRPVCYPLNSFENRVYEVELADRSRVVAKFYRPGRWSRERILEEHRFLAELEAEEIPVCAARPFPGRLHAGDDRGDPLRRSSTARVAAPPTS